MPFLGKLPKTPRGGTLIFFGGGRTNFEKMGEQHILSKNGFGGGEFIWFFFLGGGQKNLLERLENGGRYHTKKIMQRV